MTTEVVEVAAALEVGLSRFKKCLAELFRDRKALTSDVADCLAKLTGRTAVGICGALTRTRIGRCLIRRGVGRMALAERGKLVFRICNWKNRSVGTNVIR